MEPSEGPSNPVWRPDTSDAEHHDRSDPGSVHWGKLMWKRRGGSFITFTCDYSSPRSCDVPCTVQASRDPVKPSWSSLAFSRVSSQAYRLASPSQLPGVPGRGPPLTRKRYGSCGGNSRRPSIVHPSGRQKVLASHTPSYCHPPRQQLKGIRIA